MAGAAPGAAGGAGAGPGGGVMVGAPGAYSTNAAVARLARELPNEFHGKLATNPPGDPGFDHTNGRGPHEEFSALTLEHFKAYVPR